MISTGHQLRPVTTDTEGIATVTRLLEQVFPRTESFTPAVLDWQYAQNPLGAAVGCNAWAGGELVAHYAAIPLRAVVDGREERGLLSLNTATHPAHQGKGLFTRLAMATYDMAASSGFGFVVGVANANSVHGFTRKLGFQLVTSLRAMVGAGPLPMVAPAGVNFEPLRGDAFLSWRLGHPIRRYRLSTGRMDLVLADQRLGPARYVLAALPPGSVPEGLITEAALPLMKVWIGSDGGATWAPRPYLNVPMRLRPSPLHFIFKDLTGSGHRLDPRGLRFQAIDFDVL